MPALAIIVTGLLIAAVTISSVIEKIVIQDSFTITATHLLIDLNFLSNEIDTGAPTNDSALVYLTIEETGQVIPVAFFAAINFSPGGAGRPSLQAVRRAGRFKLATGWVTREIDLGKYVGMSAFLTFNVRKAAPCAEHSVSGYGVGH